METEKAHIHFDRDLNQGHIAVVTERTTIETPDLNITKVVEKGVYSFTNWKVARAFTTACNDLQEQPIAFYFKRTKESEENDKTN